jgi:hypothetical protein
MSSSRLLSRLEADIAAATHPIAADCLRAERASYLARQGRFDEAREELTRLHERYDKAPVIEVSIWLNLVDGLVSFFTDMGKLSVDKILRAHALSVASNDAQLNALCSAWLAHINFGLLRIDEMARNLADALRLAEPDRSSVLARASLVTAEALHYAHRYDLAAPWYALAKSHAIKLGDDATISALMHNMTAMKLANRRQVELTQPDSAWRAAYELQSANSTVNYDRQIGATSLHSLLPVIQAQVHALDGEVERALSIYVEAFESASVHGLQRLFATMYADRAWCHAKLEKHDLALKDAIASEANLIAETQIDERAAAHSRLAQTYALLGREDETQRHSRLATTAWAEVDALHRRIVQLLEPLSLVRPA